MRGWILAIGLAAILTGVFWYMHGYSLTCAPGCYFAHRKSSSSETAVKAVRNMATQGMRNEIIEPSFPNEASNWSDYRSRPATSAFALVEPRAAVRLDAPRADRIDFESSVLDLQRVTKSETHFADTPSVIQQVSRSQSSQLEMKRSELRAKDTYTQYPTGNSWPAPTKLLSDLTKLNHFKAAASHATMTWSLEVQQAIEQLNSLGTDDPAAAQLMDELQRLAVEALQSPSAGIHLDPAAQLQTRAAHSIIRRVAIWKAVWTCVRTPSSSAANRISFDMARLATSIDEVQSAMLTTGDAEGWEKYLSLNDLRQLAAANEIDIQMAAETAQVLLGRITSENVTEVQRRFLDSTSVRELASCLQPLAVAPVDYRSLLADLEQLEVDSEHRSRLSLIHALHSLRFADDPTQVAVSHAIDTYYRNANIRVAVASAMINRMLPTDNTIQRPVRQTILGADTRGNSNIKTSLQLRLNPDPAAWNFDLDLNGSIQSQTRSSRGPATFFNSSSSDVASTRTIRITAQGFDIQSSGADVKSQDSLRKFETHYDRIPFIGDMVRHFAQKQFDDKKGPARRIIQRAIADQTDAEFDKQLGAQVKIAEQSFEQKLIGPLRHLNLSPMVKDLQTTSDRLIARYRLASDNALAASTPRPQAPGDSMLSVQVHQSAMNNGFEQLKLASSDWTLLELAQHLAKQLGQEPFSSIPEEIPQDVLIRFEKDRPVVIEFLEGRLWLTLRVARLTQPGRMELTNFVIRTSYVPAVRGLEAELLREGAISVDGDRISMRERLPLRAIFGRVFAANSTIPMVSSTLLKDPRSEGLAISQLILEENWLAIAVSESASPHVATLREMQLTR